MGGGGGHLVKRDVSELIWVLLFLSVACIPAIIPQAANALRPFLPRPCVKPLRM